MPVTTQSRAEIFDEVIVEHSGAILHFLYSRCNDWGIAEDLAQTFWAYVFRRFSVEAMQQKRLLYHKAKQVFIDHYRKHTQRRPDLSFTMIFLSRCSCLSETNQVTPKKIFNSSTASGSFFTPVISKN